MGTFEDWQAAQKHEMDVRSRGNAHDIANAEAQTAYAKSRYSADPSSGSQPAPAQSSGAKQASDIANSNPMYPVVNWLMGSKK